MKTIEQSAEDARRDEGLIAAKRLIAANGSHSWRVGTEWVGIGVSEEGGFRHHVGGDLSRRFDDVEEAFYSLLECVRVRSRMRELSDVGKYLLPGQSDGVWRLLIVQKIAEATEFQFETEEHVRNFIEKVRAMKR